MNQASYVTIKVRKPAHVRHASEPDEGAPPQVTTRMAAAVLGRWHGSRSGVLLLADIVQFLAVIGDTGLHGGCSVGSSMLTV
jgi:hypothetical protein